jgi:hypothetical protein
MKKLLLLILFVIITYLLLIQSQQTEEGFSSYDSNNNNNKKTNNNKAVLNCYLFYTDKCPHSKRFLDSSWKTISKKYSNKVVFSKIDCHDQNTKQLSKVFNVTSVPAIFMVRDMNNEKLDKVEFLGERTPTNFENFIVKQIQLNRQSESFENQPTSTPTLLNSMDEVEFYEFEDMINKKYEYSIKYKSNPMKNIIQIINEKDTPGLHAWQGAYTVISEYIRQTAPTLDDKNKLAYEIRNKISDWHLCDPDILNNVKRNITDPIDMDVNKALNYACGF